MQTIRSDEGEMEAFLQASKPMPVSARTAPKTGGVDDILTAVVFGKKEALAEEINKIGGEIGSRLRWDQLAFRALDL